MMINGPGVSIASDTEVLASSLVVLGTVSACVEDGIGKAVLIVAVFTEPNVLIFVWGVTLGDATPLNINADDCACSWELTKIFRGDWLLDFNITE